MKKINLYLTLILMVFINQACQPDKKVHYLIVIDRITEPIIKAFEKKFTEGENSLVYRPVSGFGDISYTVFLPNAASEQFTLIFPSGDVDVEKRKKNVEIFLSSLISHKNDVNEERYVLRSIDRLLDNIIDSNTNYCILNAGGMIENSGGAISLSKQQEDFMNGNFCFSNGAECMGDYVKAATAQLDNGPGWIFDDLITSHKANSLAKRQTIYYSKTHTGLLQTIDGCSARDVELFWQKLYERLNLSAQVYTGGVTGFLEEPIDKFSAASAVQ